MGDPILQMSSIVYKEILSMSLQICHTLIVVHWDAAYEGGPWGDAQILQGGDAQPSKWNVHWGCNGHPIW